MSTAAINELLIIVCIILKYFLKIASIVHDSLIQMSFFVLIQTQMARFIIIRHVMPTLFFFAMTSHATVSRTYQEQVNTTGSRVCAVDAPSTVIPMAASTMGGRCGIECNVAPSCRLHQFKEDLAQCELFSYQPANFSPVDHCTAYAPTFRATRGS